MASGFIYAVQAPACPQYVKIGVSTNPELRLKGLQTGNPHRLVLIWSRPCESTSCTENHFHHALREHRIPGGEWFNLGPIAARPEELTEMLDTLAVSVAEKVSPERVEAAPQGPYSEDFYTDVMAA